MARRTLRRIDDLISAGLVSAQQRAALEAVAQRFSVAITPAMQDLITDPADPIGAQFVPSPAEGTVLPIERADPIGDVPHSPTPGLIHRYPDRVLLTPLLVCPVYCRFCFRREVVGGGEVRSAAELEPAFAYIEAHEQVWEVILTGGDPMALSPARMAAIIRRLDAIPHVEVIRIHSRVPVVAPERVGADMVSALKVSTPVYVVLHTNHAQELTAAATAACAALIDAGIPMLSQSVLLKGVNDSAEALTALFRALVRNRIKPYYLHHGDLAEGTSHFRTTIAEGQALMRQLRGRLSGLCQPTYVLDIPGGAGKVPVGPSYLSADHAAVQDMHAQWHPYPLGAPASRAGADGERLESGRTGPQSA